MSSSKALFLVAAIAGLLGVGTAVRQATVGAAGCSACALHSSQQDPLHVSHDGTLCTAVEHCASGEKSSQACCAADASVTTFVYEGARSACAACAEEHAIGPAEQGGPAR
ncbi:MAG: hypothetical protein D6753_03645 [Planctomycetota bacterium]|nr:MAG: hypothetical protein D6753_03645 [Planctomycetota bacterium]